MKNDMKKTNFKRVGADDLDATIEAGVERAGAARELSADEIGAVSGGASNVYVSNLARINPRWIGIWPPRDWLFKSKLQTQVQFEPELGVNLQHGAGGFQRP